MRLRILLGTLSIAILAITMNASADPEPFYQEPLALSALKPLVYEAGFGTELGSAIPFEFKMPKPRAHSHARSAPNVPDPNGNCGGWEDLVRSYFGPATGEACAIIRCETGGTFDASIIGGPNRNGTYDVGLMQINDIHGQSIEWRQDPNNNLAYGASLYHSSGWRPWTCRSVLR